MCMKSQLLRQNTSGLLPVLNMSIDEVKYQKFIDDFINKQKKPIIFVGLNDNILGTKNIYYNVHSQYNFYIDIDDKIILKQKCIRFITDDLP